MAGKSEGQRVNHLYWETDGSVAEIAEEMGLSRRALYELIEPLPAGAGCTQCGAELYFANRSAKASALGRCLICGNEHAVQEAEDVEQDVDSDAGVNAPARFQGHKDVWPYVVIGAAVAGIIATLIIRRRRH